MLFSIFSGNPVRFHNALLSFMIYRFLYTSHCIFSDFFLFPWRFTLFLIIFTRIFSILFLCRFSRISLNSLSFSFSLVKNFFILFRHFSVVFQLVKIPFLNSVLNKRRRRDLNPRAATNDLLPFQGSPFGQLGYFSIKNGEGGIRTHAPFRTNGFQDRLVMTTSISLRMCVHFLVISVVYLTTKAILTKRITIVNTFLHNFYFNFFQ